MKMFLFFLLLIPKLILAQEIRTKKTYQKETYLQELSEILNKMGYSDSKKLLDSLENRSLIQQKMSLAGLVKNSFTHYDIRKKLKHGEVVIEVVRFNKHTGIEYTGEVVYLALILTSNLSDKIEMVKWENGNKLEEEHLSYYQKCLRNDVKDEHSYSNFWGVIKDSKALSGSKISKVYFSPKGVFGKINLNKLYNPVSRKYLIDEIDIQLLLKGSNELMEKN